MKKILFGILMVISVITCHAQVNTNTVTIHIGGHVFTLSGDIDLGGTGNLQQTIVDGDSMITKLPNITIITNSKTHKKDIYINGGAEDMAFGTGSTYMNFGGQIDSMFNNRNSWGINIPDFSFNWDNGNLPGNVDSMMKFERKWMDTVSMRNRGGNRQQQYYYWNNTNDSNDVKEKLQEKLEDLQDKLNDMQGKLNDMQEKVNESPGKNNQAPVQQDTTRVRVGGLRIVISHNGVAINPSDSGAKCLHPKTITTHWILLDVGFDMYLNNFSTNLPAGYSGLELIQGKSANVNLQLFQQSVNLCQQHLFFSYGLGFDFYNYRFRQNILLVPKSDVVQIVEAPTQLSKDKLSDTYLTVPILFQYESCTNYSKSFHLGLGMNIGYLIASHTKQVSSEYGKVKVWDNYNLNTFSYGPTFRIGFSWFNLYANYGLNGLFRSGSAPLLNPLSFGISIIAD